jgi:hypothetical protein
VCTLPVTQIVSVFLAVLYVLTHPDMPRAQAWAVGVGIVALFQVIPISPGSFVRGSYVVYLVLRERNFRDYNIAVFLGFFKYVGYLAFPIQMTYRYPALARFMAAHWATEAVHVVPVFGEAGALLEHWTFRLFYNWPLTIRRRMRRRAEMRARVKPRYWHASVYALAAGVGLGCMELALRLDTGARPELVGYLVALMALLGGIVTALGCGGAPLARRIVAASLCGVSLALAYTVASAAGSAYYGDEIAIAAVAVTAVWRLFVATLFATLAGVLTELLLPDPDLEQQTG